MVLTKEEKEKIKKDLLIEEYKAKILKNKEIARKEMEKRNRDPQTREKRAKDILIKRALMDLKIGRGADGKFTFRPTLTEEQKVQIMKRITKEQVQEKVKELKEKETIQLSDVENKNTLDKETAEGSS